MTILGVISSGTRGPSVEFRRHAAHGPKQRQDHEGQVRVDDAEVDRQARAHDLEGVMDESEVQEHGVQQAVVADDAFNRADTTPPQEVGNGWTDASKSLAQA